jgi:hypothetical protein
MISEHFSDTTSAFLAGYNSRNDEVHNLQIKVDQLTKLVDSLKSALESLNKYEYNESSEKEERIGSSFYSIQE